MTNTAILSSFGEYSTFCFGGKTITFYTGKNLLCYTRIVEWDNGYLVVMRRTKTDPDKELEDYIDLIPILENLYINPSIFLAPIQKVQVQYSATDG